MTRSSSLATTACASAAVPEVLPTPMTWGQNGMPGPGCRLSSRWVVRQDVDPTARALLQDTLYVGLEVGVEALYGITEPREDLLMLPRDIARYIRNFRYYIGTSEQQALDLFRHYLQRLER